MFQKFSIRSYLIGTFLIFTLALTCITTFGIYAIFRNYQLLLSHQKKHIEPVQYLYELKDRYLIPIQTLLQPLISHEPKEQTTQLWQESVEHLFKARTIFNQLYDEWQSFPIEPFSQINNSSVKSFSSQLEMIQKQLQNLNKDTETVESWLPEKYSLLINMMEMEEQLEAIIESFVFNDFNAAFQGYSLITRHYPFQIGLIVTLYSMSLFLLWLVGLPFIKKVISSLSSVSDELKGLVSDDADLTKRLAVHQNNEIGKISHSFNLLMDNLLELTRRVQRSGLQVFGSANSISASSKLLENTIANFNNSTHEIVTTAKQISGTSQQLVHTMANVTQIASNTATLAASGQKGLEKIELTIGGIEEAFKAIASKLGTISEKAANITMVVTTITKIADQTNLLSLNASIEAEKAGEVGLGFAVIARETRRLADQTAVATLDIEKMVSEMKSSVNSGVMSIENFSKQLNQYVNDVRIIAAQQAQIIEQVQTLTPRFETVHSGMQSQSHSALQISESMIQLSLVAEQAHEALKQSNYAIEQLNAAARGLQKEVSRFKVSN
ncbi:MAG: methyl-accepting chemotaxis sensory transducer [Chlamydiales bacterium]|jgi:methyl-accepting chemotaxis protein WspA|nr:methyl-accepting chemotaxis sensory transducer [Chlamydiales bacterium]